MSARCLLRYLESKTDAALLAEGLARKARGDDEASAVYGLLAKHREEILEDLRAGAAVRELDRRNLLTIRRDARPNLREARWGVGLPGSGISGDGETLGQALENFDAATRLLHDPRRN